MAVEYLDESPSGGVEFLDEIPVVTPVPTSTLGVSSPSTDRGGIGYALNPEESKDIAAQRLVARGRAAGQTDLLTRDEANKLAADAGIPGLPEGVHAVSLNDVGSPFVRNLLKVKETVGAAGFGIGPAIAKMIEDATMNPAQKAIFGQTALRERTPEITSGSQFLGSLAPVGAGAQLISKAPTLGQRIGRSVLTGAGIGGTYGGAGVVAEKGTETTIPELAVGTLGGAAIGGTLGVAAGSAKPIGQATSELFRSVKTQFNPTAFEQLTQAVRPANKLSEKWSLETITPAMQTIKDLGASGKTPQGIQGTIEASRQAQDKVYSLLRSVTDDPQALVVDGKALEEKIINSVANDKTLTEDPAAVKAIVNNFKGYFRDIPLDEAQRLIEQTNAQLQGPLYNRTIQGQAAVRSDLETASQKAFGDALRAERDKVLETKLGENGKDLGKLYGSIAQIKLAAQNRFLVAARQAMVNLPEQLQYSNAAADVAESLVGSATGNPIAFAKGFSGATRALLTRILKEANKSERQITSAFDKIKSGKSPLLQYDIPENISERPSYNVQDIEEAILRSRELNKPTSTAISPDQLQEFIKQSLQKSSSSSPITNLETAIADKIKTYPKKLRDDPNLARIAAKSELGLE